MSSLFQLESYFLRCRIAIGKVLRLHLTEMQCAFPLISQPNAKGHFLWPLATALIKGQWRRARSKARTSKELSIRE